MRSLVLALGLVLWPLASARAQVEVEVGVGVDVPAYPDLVQVPGEPVYYAPGLRANYFFYDGTYWVYAGDSWHRSTWYNGPWYRVGPEAVPVYVLRVPCRYYRQPPAYFAGWRREAPPRWGEHWGHDWERRHEGWDHWDRRHVPRAAPLPVYQRRYSGASYPRDDEARRRYEVRDHRAAPQEHVVRSAAPQEHVVRSAAPQEHVVRGAPQEHVVRAAPQPQSHPSRQEAQPREREQREHDHHHR